MRFSLNHLANFSLLAEKQIAASKIKGVVGKTGKATPTAPSAKQINPEIVSTIFLINQLHPLLSEQIKSVGIHHLIPCSNEITKEFIVCIITCIDFCNGSKLRV